MTYRDFFDTVRQQAKRAAEDAAQSLDASKTSDGKMAPHVVVEKVAKLRKLARQLDTLADIAENFQ